MLSDHRPVFAQFEYSIELKEYKPYVPAQNFGLSLAAGKGATFKKDSVTSYNSKYSKAKSLGSD